MSVAKNLMMLIILAADNLLIGALYINISNQTSCVRVLAKLTLCIYFEVKVNDSGVSGSTRN